jgi:hypothetical protein
VFFSNSLLRHWLGNHSFCSLAAEKKAIHYEEQLFHQVKMIEKSTVKSVHTRLKPSKKVPIEKSTWLLKQWRSNLHTSIYYHLLNSSKTRLKTSENSQQILSPLKPIKNKVKREVVQFYIARRAAIKSAVYCKRI